MQIQVNAYRHIVRSAALITQVVVIPKGARLRFSNRIKRVEVHLTDESCSQTLDRSDKRSVLDARQTGQSATVDTSTEEPAPASALRADSRFLTFKAFVHRDPLASAVFENMIKAASPVVNTGQRKMQMHSNLGALVWLLEFNGLGTANSEWKNADFAREVVPPPPQPSPFPPGPPIPRPDPLPSPNPRPGPIYSSPSTAVFNHSSILSAGEWRRPRSSWRDWKSSFCGLGSTEQTAFQYANNGN